MAKYILPDLEYDFGALEPHISGQIMQLHHDKHHATYVKKANETLEKLDEARDKSDFTRLGGAREGPRLQPLRPRPALALLAQPDPEGRRTSEGRAGQRDHARLRQLRKLPEADHRGRGDDHGLRLGRARLRADGGPAAHAPRSTTTSRTSRRAGVPLLVIDAWEHAYYLQYKTEKTKFFEAVWNLWNWDDVARALRRRRAG